MVRYDMLTKRIYQNMYESEPHELDRKFCNFLIINEAKTSRLYKTYWKTVVFQYEKNVVGIDAMC